MLGYNFQYLLDLKDQEDNTYELDRIIHAVDTRITDAKPSMLFHIVPILYSIAIATGTAVYVYALL